MKLFKLVPTGKCTKNVGLTCGYAESRHPLNVSGNYHEFQGGGKKYVPATPEDIKAAAQKLDD